MPFTKYMTAIPDGAIGAPVASPILFYIKVLIRICDVVIV